MNASESTHAIEEVEAQYYERLARAGVPAHLHGGLMRYFVHRLPPGNFLMAVLNNNLSESFNRADDESRAGLFALVKFLYNNGPYMAWGSPLIVEQWLARKRKS